MTSAVKLVEQWHAEWLASSDETHWGYKMDWYTADEIARRIDEANAPEPESCPLVPIAEGYCLLPAGHKGPCKIASWEG